MWERRKRGSDQWEEVAESRVPNGVLERHNLLTKRGTLPDPRVGMRMSTYYWRYRFCV